MYNKFLSAIKKHNMITRGDRVLLAVSGGADSIVMLKLFSDCAEELGITIEVANVEHGIRGDESLGDSEFVRSYAECLGVKFSMLSINATEEARKCGKSVEEYSREKRYEYFNTFDVDKIATAHNADDNAETLIYRLARGTGLKGAASIPPVRGKIIRPLIECTSREIRAYADDNKIPYRIDSTNSDDAYTRNYIRNNIIPMLRNVNSSAVGHINDFISDASEDSGFIESFSSKAYSECTADGKIDIKLLSQYDTAVIKRIIMKYFEDYGCIPDRLHLSEIMKLIGKSGKVQIKGDDYAVSYGGRLYYADASDIKELSPVELCVTDIVNFEKSDVDFYCDYDKIIGSAFVRSRIQGDTISPIGRGCTKSLKKLFNEYKIPEAERQSIPVICDREGVIGIVGYCADERVKVDGTTEKILYCKIPMED